MMKQKLLILTTLLPLCLFAHESTTSGTAVHGAEHGLLSVLSVVAVLGTLAYCAWLTVRASR